MNKTSSRLLACTLLLGTSMMLSACQTTGSTGTGGKDPVNAAIERGHAGPDTEQVDSLASIERLYKQNSTDPAIAVRYSRALRDNGRMTRAAMVLNPLIENPKTKTLGVVTEYAAVQAAMGNYEAAEKHARSAVLIDPNSAQSYHVLGIALDAQGFHKQAEVAFRKALDNWSGDPSPVLNNLGLNLAAQGFLDEAISTLRRAAGLSPDKTEIERNLRIVQALQVNPGTAGVPFAQTKAEQAAKKAGVKPAESTSDDKPEAKAATKSEKKKDAEPAASKPAAQPAKQSASQTKSGDIVVEDLNDVDKTEEPEAKPAMAPAKALRVNQ